VGLQLVGRRLQEEKLITLAAYIGEQVKLEQPVSSTQAA
jgi:Asp-tRNA(Asn)/Glu-tRNA(Gln) amidotransferase A subunit family amidase